MLVIVCSNPALLIDTVRSRVTRLDFARYSREEVLEAYRKTGVEAGEESEEFIVSYADGIIGRALQLKDFGLYGTLRERILDTLLVIKKSQGRFLTEFTELFMDKDSSANKDYMFFELTSFVRDAALFARLGDPSALQNTHFQNKIKELAAVTGRHGWEKILDAVNSAYRLAGQNVNYRMVTVNLAAAIIEAVRN
jgi:DNA polymerase-3 subunit delta'